MPAGLPFPQDSTFFPSLSSQVLNFDLRFSCAAFSHTKPHTYILPSSFLLEDKAVKYEEIRYFVINSYTQRK